MAKSIYLSPSTQENNIGAGAYGTEEKRMNSICDVVEKILDMHQVTVFRNNPSWDLKKVVEDSNSKSPNLHFAIHSNAGGGRGCEVYAYTAGGNGEMAANYVYKEVEPLTPTADRGVKFNPSLYELKYTKAPAALIEVAFHDNASDAGWIANNIEVIGTAIAKGILKYFGIVYVEEKPAKSNINANDIFKLLDEIKVELDKIKGLVDKLI